MTVSTGLGRNYVPDERDWKLDDFQQAGEQLQAGADSLQVALTALTNSKAVAPAVKAWARLATARIVAVSPAPPPPAPPKPAPTGDRKWSDPDPTLAQGQQGTCVGHGWAQWGNHDPVFDHYTHETALDIYLAATTNDGHPDDPRKPGGGQQGASIRGGAKALQAMGRLSNYAFTQSIDTAHDWVQKTGPIVLGVKWYTDMFKPQSGVITPTGSYAGGHCILWTGNVKDQAELHNSWSDQWGLRGYCRIALADLEKLLKDQGEACAAVELPR